MSSKSLLRPSSFKNKGPGHHSPFLLNEVFGPPPKFQLRFSYLVMFSCLFFMGGVPGFYIRGEWFYATGALEKFIRSGDLAYALEGDQVVDADL